MSEQQILNVVWRRRTLDLVPESYFIEHVLLGDLGRPVRTIPVEALADAPFHDNVLVVSMMTEFADYLAEARRRGARNLMLFHLGDEQAACDLGFYDDADLVIRNYWFETIMSRAKVAWVPNGYALGVGPTARTRLVRAGRRSTQGFFAGAMGMRVLSDERFRMKAAVEAAGLPFELRVTATARDRLGPSAYGARLRDARAALVPGGNSPETIRLYDALECGAIPIMLRSPFVGAADGLDEPPFILLDDWTELADAWAPYSDGSRRAGDDLDALQDRVLTWWEAFKRRQQRKLRGLIDSLLSPAA